MKRFSLADQGMGAYVQLTTVNTEYIGGAYGVAMVLRRKCVKSKPINFLHATGGYAKTNYGAKPGQRPKRPERPEPGSSPGIVRNTTLGEHQCCLS